jgi:uncharacterized protein YjbI with pentapeptide repeats
MLSRTGANKAGDKDCLHLARKSRNHWWQKRWFYGVVGIVGLGGLVLILSLLLCDGNLDQCLFLGKSIWNWLELSSSLALPILLVLLAFFWYQVQLRNQKRTEEQVRWQKEQIEKQAELEKEIALANQRERSLEKYLDQMSELLLALNSKNLPNENYIRDLIITKTLIILQRLGDDSSRKTTVISFLKEAHILSTVTKKFSQVDLSLVNLKMLNLRGANFSGANFSGANLRGADLFKADLFKANLERANLGGAKLMGADLTFANLEGSDLTFTKLMGADLAFANFEGADFEGAELMGADLREADFREHPYYGQVKNLTPQQIKEADNWEQAYYDPDFRKELGLPP